MVGWFEISFTKGPRGAKTVEFYRIFLFIRILTFSNRKCKYHFLYFSFITLYQSFTTFLWQAFCNRWPLFAVSKMNKKSCLLCGNFISIYIINRILHGRLGIRILSYRLNIWLKVSLTGEPRSLVRDTFSTRR